MKFPNWFKITWWAVLLVIVIYLLYFRIGPILSGKSIGIDNFLFAMFIALMLVPIFVEMEFLGLKFKSEIQDLKHQLELQIGNIQNEVRNHQNQSFTATINGFELPPTDNQLSEVSIEAQRLRSIKSPAPQLITFDVSDEVIDLFKIRYVIEQHIIRLPKDEYSSGSVLLTTNKPPVFVMLNDLKKYGVLQNNLFKLIKDLLAICNYSIHGRSPSEKQLKFTKENANDAIHSLRAIS